jgi:hypothetical protein
MLTWLVHIPHDPKQTKPEVYGIIKQHKTKYLQYILDTELEKHGHRVLRLPPYHPKLNPIEKIWAQVKNWIACELAEDKLSMITPKEWAKVCGHVDKVVAKYMQTEHLLDEASEELNFVVKTGDSDHEFTNLSEDDNDGNISGVDTLSDVD